MLDLPELGRFSPSPQYPTDPASTQFPPKHRRQHIWIQVPALPLTPWPWPTPAPSTSVFTHMMLCGVVTRPLLPLPRLTASTWPQGYPVFYRPDPWQGHRAGQGNGGRTMNTLFCFLKKNTVYFRLMETFRALLCSVRPSVCLSKVPGCWGGPRSHTLAEL